MNNQFEIINALINGETIIHKCDTYKTAKLVNNHIDLYGFNDYNMLLKHPQYWDIKPKVIAINGIDVPAPLTTKPEMYQEYFVPKFGWTCNYQLMVWKNSGVDNINFENGMCHSNSKNAAIHAQALLSFSQLTQKL